MEELKDELNSKIQEHVLLNTNLENQNRDIRNQLNILQQSQNYFSKALESQVPNEILDEFEALK